MENEEKSKNQEEKETVKKTGSKQKTHLFPPVCGKRCGKSDDDQSLLAKAFKAVSPRFPDKNS